ncbi:methyltransferase domain-containing protein [Streptomyces sp. NPDC006529]|uniref:protein-L-isoaspartate O-methyltransferase family protein n=1 Tax=Streptomyces sp. NPDC006529 TaxID=3157177 RepID=UPI0033B9EB7B
MDTAPDPAEPRRRPAASPMSGLDRAVCRTALETMALLREPWMSAAFDAVDREAFVPAAVWLPERDERGLWKFLDRATDPGAWSSAVWDPHRSVVTQLDDGRTAPTGAADGDFTSSVSALDIVLRKLSHLKPGAADRVLEIGYASGYHTALLCERVGSERVTSVEVDAALAARGAENLKAAGYEPHLVCGDGLTGVPERAPFDRVINTASVRRVPWAWVEQTRDGGVILTPFGTAYSNAGLLRLTAHGRRATGRFAGSSSYMWVRDHRPPHTIRVDGRPRRRASPVRPAEVLGGGWEQNFAVGLQVPDVTYSHRGDGEEEEVQFVDLTGTSVSIVRYGGWWEPDAVRSWGPRDLWAELTSAYTWYQERGRPPVTEFGLTVDERGQRAWLGHSGNPLPMPVGLGGVGA